MIEIIEKATVKAIIFDLDGTLVYTMEDLLTAMNAMLESYGFETHTTESLNKFINFGGRAFVKGALGIHATSDEFINEALVRYKKFYDEFKLDKSVPYDGISEMLKVLKNNGIKLAVLTNKDDIFAKPIIEGLFPGVFDLTLGFNGEFRHKPDPQSSHYITETFGVRPEEILYIGDSYVDMQTAAAAGFKAVWVSWGYGSIDSLEYCKDAVRVDSAEEIIKLVNL